MDLKNFIDTVGIANPVVLGCSMGCAVIWSFIELFGDDAFSACIFVDQTPCQYVLEDWDKDHASKGIYDDASVLAIRKALHASMADFAAGNEACCVTHPISPEMSALLASETMKCNPGALSSLMDNHARLDWRPILMHRIAVPCLNMYGTESGCFHTQGTRSVSTLIKNCVDLPFHGYNHWLYIENPLSFAEAVGDFLNTKVIT